MSPRIEVHDDADALATAVAGELLSRLADVQSAGRVPQIVLTGGGTAQAIHRELARLSPSSEVDWSRVGVWFGDERFVAGDSPDRNARQAREAFLDAVGATQVHEVPAADRSADVEEAATSYGATVREHGAGLFDVVMLSVGPDGHVASLFPGHPALGVQDPITVAVADSPKPPPERVSLTFSALNRTTSLWLLGSGEAKADAVARALAADGSIAETPARGVHGLDDTTVFLDRPAAALL